MMPQSENGGAQSLIGAFGSLVHDGERTTSYERNGYDDSYYGSVHCNLPTGPLFFSETRANKTTRVQLRRRSRFSVMPYHRRHRSAPCVIAAFAGSAHVRQSAADYDYNHNKDGQLLGCS